MAELVGAMRVMSVQYKESIAARLVARSCLWVEISFQPLGA